MVSKLYLAGWTQMAIAAELNVNQSTISRCLKKLTQRWLEESKINFDEAKAKELARINRLENEYWDAWQKSCEDYKEQEIQSNEKSESKTIGKVAKTQKQNGDPRFLEGVRNCIEMRCKLLGLNAPTKLNHTLTGDPDSPIPILVLKNVSMDDLCPGGS